MVKSKNNMKKKHRHGMKIISAIHRTKKLTLELIREVNRREINMRREKFKKMITKELLKKFQEPWRKKYHKIVNERVRVKGWVYYDIVTSDKSTFIKQFKKKHRGRCPDINRYKKDVLSKNIVQKKRALKPIQNKTFKNDDFIAYNNPYVKFKINQKDEELKRKNEEMSIMKEQLERMNGIGWSLLDLVNGDTYSGRMQDIKGEVESLLTSLGHDVYLPFKWRWERGKVHKLICRGDTKSWSPWKLKTEQDAKL